ncbi:hypothetical protein ASF21_12720 [Arthrobacter sp. Leaf234]|uniref:hypothetical protein n=1 Tax=Arthrobacter sp. Leaf234 TaxID=1736303 RepID=UPI0006F26D7D|nr:hypothetical protein [Arthrobacter sp. Leaf234]KQN99664.1 hypothetical protein ASF21_12720 [Arthrobacter sp. Leaf234]
MTELTTASNPAALALPVPAALPQTDAVVQLHEWAAELAAARQLAQVLASSSFLPLALREKRKGVPKDMDELTFDAAAVILAGKSVGLDPMQAVQNIFPVHGMPSMYARTMVALVIGQGHGVKRSAATDDSVTYSVRRKGEEQWQDFTWTIARAKKAGYTTNAKYQSDPIAMLGAKAAAEACRTVFPDILLGMAYSAEEIELEDMGERVPATQSQAPGQSATARLAAAAQTPQPEAAPAVEATEPLCSRAQQTALGNALKALGHTTKDEMLAVVTAWVGRDLTGSKDLTVGEAKQLTDELEAEAAERNQAAEDVVDADGVIPTVVDADADAAWLAGTN